jgi:hypothetical protein
LTLRTFAPFLLGVVLYAALAKLACREPVALDVSPSRSDRNTISRSPNARIVVMTSAALRPSRSVPTTTTPQWRHLRVHSRALPVA